jgi:hypothetical protein
MSNEQAPAEQAGGLGGTAGPGGGAARSWDARRVSRKRVAALKCDAGSIVDFSARGMRLTCRRGWKVAASRDVAIASAEASISVRAKCVWTRREGLMKHLVGLAFEGMSAEQTRALEKFVADHAVNLDLDVGRALEREAA